MQHTFSFYYRTFAHGFVAATLLMLALFCAHQATQIDRLRQERDTLRSQLAQSRPDTTVPVSCPALQGEPTVTIWTYHPTGERTVYAKCVYPVAGAQQAEQGVVMLQRKSQSPTPKR